MDANLIILAGGISSRMKKDVSATIDPEFRREAEEKSKAMIGVGPGRRPLLDYLLDNAREAGYHDVVIVVGEKDRSIREYYGQADERKTGLHLSYAVQSIPAGRIKPLGTADALLQGVRSAPRWRGQKFTVCNSDNLYSRKALRLMLECPGMGGMIDYDRSALGFEQARIEQFAVTEKTDDGFLVDIVEKPSSADIDRLRNRSGRIGVSMNIFRLPYDESVPILESVPMNPVRQEKELPTAVAMFIQLYPRSIKAIPLAEYVPDLTSQPDIVRVQEYLKREFPKFI
jgi:NDP-sugar pyrophosphorylase family protein